MAMADPGDETRVTTGLIGDESKVQLCDVWLDSYPPPQCEMSVAIEITGAPLGELGLEQAGGVYFGTVDIVMRWNDDETAQFVERGE